VSAGDALDAAQAGLAAAQAGHAAAQARLDAAQAGLDAAQAGLGAAQAGLAAASPPGALTKVHQVGFNNVLLFMCWLSREVSPATWFKWDESERAIHRYVFGWLVPLSLILAVGPAVGWPRFVMLGIVFYRLQELMFATLDNALMLTARGQKRHGFAWQTPLMLALVDIIQIVLIFAVAYLILTGQNRGAFSYIPPGRFGEFFLSWISLPPLGGGATPLSIMARVLTISEEATGLLMIVIAVGRFLAGPT
jgi:hypothetical protein